MRDERYEEDRVERRTTMTNQTLMKRVESEYDSNLQKISQVSQIVKVEIENRCNTYQEFEAFRVQGVVLVVVPDLSTRN
jgi:hypothetical protein